MYVGMRTTGRRVVGLCVRVGPAYLVTLVEGLEHHRADLLLRHPAPVPEHHHLMSRGGTLTRRRTYER